MLYSMTKLAAKESDPKKVAKKKEDKPKTEPPPPKKEHKSPKTAPPVPASVPKNSTTKSMPGGVKKPAAKDTGINKKKNPDLKSIFRQDILTCCISWAQQVRGVKEKIT